MPNQAEFFHYYELSKSYSQGDKPLCCCTMHIAGNVSQMLQNIFTRRDSQKNLNGISTLCNVVFLLVIGAASLVVVKVGQAGNRVELSHGKCPLISESKMVQVRKETQLSMSLSRINRTSSHSEHSTGCHQSQDSNSTEQQQTATGSFNENPSFYSASSKNGKKDDEVGDQLRIGDERNFFTRMLIYSGAIT